MKESNKKAENRFLHGAISLSVATLLVKILGVAYKIPLSHILEDDGMGIFNTAYTVYTFFVLVCSAGIPKAITILVNETESNTSRANANLLKTAGSAFLLIGTFLALIFAFVALPLANLIGSKKSALAMLAIAPSIPFIAVTAVYRGYLNGKMRFGSVAVSQLFEAAFKLVLGLCFAYIALKLGAESAEIAAAAIFGITAGALLVFMHAVLLIKNEKKAENPRQNAKFDTKLLENVFRISLPITLSSAVLSVVNIIDLTIIMRGLNQNGYSESLATSLYGNYTTLAVPMFNFALSLISSVCISALPILIELSVKKDAKEFYNVLSCTADLVAFFALPATIMFLLFPREILLILFDYGSVSLGSALLSLLAPSVIFIGVLTVINMVLEAKGGYMAPFISMSIGGIIKLVSSFLLVRQTDFAIWGAPIGTAISYVASIVISVFLCRKKTGGILPIFRGFIICGICAFFAAVPAVAIKNSLSSNNPGILVSLILLTTFAFFYFVFTLLAGAMPLKRLKNMAK